ncbi:MAG: transglycosylase SLT domain-containing protein [bacterium JZ-2024 1]
MVLIGAFVICSDPRAQQKIEAFGGWSKLATVITCIIEAESSFNPTACSKDCGLGLMQITTRVWPPEGCEHCSSICPTKTDWNCAEWSNPVQNIACGMCGFCCLLAQCQTIVDALKRWTVTWPDRNKWFCACLRRHGLTYPGC